jgi:hypothetical protein
MTFSGGDVHNRKCLSIAFSAAAIVILLALGTASALAAPPTCDPTDPDCDPPPPPPVVTHPTAHLTVVAPAPGTIVDTGAPTGDINCGADCSGSYTFTRTCQDLECTDSDFDSEVLTASGGPAGDTAEFHVCQSNPSGTTCFGETICPGEGECDLTMDANYRVSVVWKDTSPPSMPSVTGPTKVGPTVKHFTATATDNHAVTAMQFHVGDNTPSTDGTPDVDHPGTYEYDVPVADLGEGDHTLKAKALDGAGNPSDSEGTATFTVDKSANVAITSPAAGGEFQDAPSVTFTHDADVGDITCQTLNGGSVVHESACSTAYTPQITNGDGAYVARVIFTDDVGNQAIAERGFKIDTGDPNVTITSPTANQHVKSPFTPSFTATDGVTPSAQLVKRCKVDAGAAYGGCASLTASDGPHTLFVRAVDHANNVRVESVVFTADSTAPHVTVTSGPPDTSIVTSATVTYAWGSTDASPPLNATCRLDSAAAAPCASPKTLSGLSEGSHTLVLRVRDSVGNAAEVERELFVNAVRPSISITSGPGDGAIVKANSVTFGFAAAGGAVACALDSETAYRPCSSSGSDVLSGLADGAHTFRVRVRDESDDVVVQSRSFAVDTSRPRTIVNATIETNPLVFKRYTIYKRLVIKHVPRGATVSVACKGKKCPAKRFSKRGGGSVKLKKFTKRKLRVGTRLTVRVTQPGAIGKQFVIKIRKGKLPKLTISQIA